MMTNIVFQRENVIKENENRKAKDMESKKTV